MSETTPLLKVEGLRVEFGGQLPRGDVAPPGREAEFRDSFLLALEYAQVLQCPRLHVMAGLVPTARRNDATGSPARVKRKLTSLATLPTASMLMSFMVTPVAVMAGPNPGCGDSARPVLDRGGTPGLLWTLVATPLQLCIRIDGSTAPPP